MTIPNILSKLLILLIISTGLAAHAEDIVKLYEIDNVLITFFWFDTELEMQKYYAKHFLKADINKIDPLMRGFSADEPYIEKNICHLDLYAVRPLKVDDDMTLTIGHEVLHCVHGQYHKVW